METIQANFVTNGSKFLENYVNLTHKILGKTLKPFCLLHLLWLENIGSPLFKTSEAVTLSDLEIAVLICSSSSSEEILKKLSRKRRLWHLWNTRRDLQEESKAFIVYQDDFASMPTFSDSEKGESLEQIPWLLTQMAALIRETGWQEESILLMPLGKVIWYNSAFCYLATGNTSIISDKEQAASLALEQLTKGNG